MFYFISLRRIDSPGLCFVSEKILSSPGQPSRTVKNISGDTSLRCCLSPDI